MKATDIAVVSDTTPLNYLILIGRADTLGMLFGEVLVPEAVFEELCHPKAPPAVTAWLMEMPPWFRVTPVLQHDLTICLGKGENAAISLAVERRARVVLMDERVGREAARVRGLAPIGTLNLIDLADEMGLIDGITALQELRRTTFRAGTEMFGRLDARMRERRV